MKKIILFIAILLLVTVTIGAIRETNKSKLEVDLKKIELKNNEQTIRELEHSKNQTRKEIIESEKKRKELEEANKKLKKQIQAKAQIKQERGAKVYAEAVSGSEAEAKAFIYQKESGNNPSAVNAGGCRGLGQACPGTKLPCGNDYACQDAWFTDYMKNRYGTWVNAKAHWLSRVPINGQDVGHWW